MVTEKQANGYVIDNAQRIIHLEPGQTGEFVFTNSIKPSLRLLKQSTNGTPLAGVTLRLSGTRRREPITWIEPQTMLARSW